MIKFVSMMADFTHLLLAALLAEGGVELNPGPKCQYVELSKTSKLSENSPHTILPKLLSQPTFLSDTDIMLIQQEVTKCRQEILNKSDELCEKTKELNMKDSLLAEKDNRITNLLETCAKMKTTLLLQEDRISQLEKQSSAATLAQRSEDLKTLDLKCKEFEKQVGQLECTVANLSEEVHGLTEKVKQLLEKLNNSEMKVFSRLELVARCQEGDWRSALPLLEHSLARDSPAHQQLCAVRVHTHCLAEAASQGHVDLVREFLRHGFPPDTVVINDGTTMLHRAAWHGRTDLVQLLLDYRAPVDARDSVYSRTALMYAAMGGHERTASCLLDHGACAGAVDGPGWSALHLAAMMGHEHVARCLVSAGADLALRSGNGQTAGDIARQYHKHRVAALLSRPPVASR
ncbi:ankyrin repeat domain-containing protein 27-like isoform X2 [Bacillus rossius redtenbacheri]